VLSEELEANNEAYVLNIRQDRCWD